MRVTVSVVFDVPADEEREPLPGVFYPDRDLSVRVLDLLQGNRDDSPQTSPVKLWFEGAQAP